MTVVLTIIVLLISLISTTQVGGGFAHNYEQKQSREKCKRNQILTSHMLFGGKIHAEIVAGMLLWFDNFQRINKLHYINLAV